MSEFKHTPGPWESLADDDDCGIWAEVKGEREFIAQAYGFYVKGNYRYTEQTKANARLIAAAPILLGQHEADMVDLDLLAKAIHAGDPMHELILRVADMMNRKRAAIAKATGHE